MKQLFIAGSSIVLVFVVFGWICGGIYNSWIRVPEKKEAAVKLENTKQAIKAAGIFKDIDKESRKERNKILGIVEPEIYEDRDREEVVGVIQFGNHTSQVTIGDILRPSSR